MHIDQVMQAGYLVLLGIVVVGYLAIQSRGHLKTMLKQGATWLFIFATIVVGYGVWSDMSEARLPRQSVFAEEGRIEVPRAGDGHYHLILRINGVPVPMIVDTGASDLVLSRADALRVGLAPEALVFTGRAQTANGRVETAHVRLPEVSVGGITDRFVPAVVNSGDMQKSLLGMSYLNRFSRIEMTRDRLILTR